MLDFIRGGKVKQTCVCPARLCLYDYDQGILYPFQTTTLKDMPATDSIEEHFQTVCPQMHS